MRLYAAVLLMVASSTVYGQTSAAVPADLDKLFRSAPQAGQQTAFQPGKADLSALSSVSILRQPDPASLKSVQGDFVFLPSATTSIDPGMIHRPDAALLGSLPAGNAVLPDLYPGLRFQRIQSTKLTQTARLLPLPTVWPKFEIKPIPPETQAVNVLPVKDRDKPTKTADLR